jgi:hypothetical protein
MYVEIIVFVYLNLDFLLNRNSYVETVVCADITSRANQCEMATRGTWIANEWKL